MDRLVHLDHKKIDISGPKGNAFALLGIVTSLLRQCKISQDEIDRFLWEAKSGDYQNLCEVVTETTGIQLIDGREDDDWL